MVHGGQVTGLYFWNIAEDDLFRIQDRRPQVDVNVSIRTYNVYIPFDNGPLLSTPAASTLACLRSPSIDSIVVQFVRR